MRGLFISLEGIDGSGKTSLREWLLSNLIGFDVITVREPGGTVISEKIRAILLDVRSQGMTSSSEAFLYAAARSQLVEEVIKPALNAGKVVIADRYLDSTIAYQGYGRGLDLRFLNTLNELCTGGLRPDLTLLLDLEPLEGQQRRGTAAPDRLEKEGLEFQDKVRRGYLEIARLQPQRIKVLDASKNLNEVGEKALEYIREKLLEER
ncbi:dTMP kinase [Syntrophomonas palmitatica]|uniref:dTMP kinase n=1 Tax=Syntrophomonas palmitatica TaxID=402877 RepID=UPI000A8919FF|nr:dTMP kinase [Syntrophomonas palmitatica]